MATARTSTVAARGDHRARQARSGAVAVPLTLVAAFFVVMVVCDARLRDDGRGELASLTLSQAAWPVGALVAAITGTVLAARIRHVVGGLLLGIAVAVTGIGAAQSYAGAGAVARPGSLPAASWVAPIGNALFAFVPALLTLIVVRTPTGRPAGRRERVLTFVALGGAATWAGAGLLSVQPVEAAPLPPLPNPWVVGWLDGGLGTGLTIIGAMAVHASLLAAGVLFVVRFRRASGVERQQLRWVVFGAAVTAAAFAVAFIAGAAGMERVLDLVGAVVVSVLPITVTVAISRYRLYELDRIVSRSVLLLVLTALVTAFYIAVVSVLALLGGDDRSSGVIAAVAAALSIAPLRAAVQRRVDRSLFGRRTEPFAVVSGLNRRLQDATTPLVALQELTDIVAADLRLPFVAVESADGAVLASHGPADAPRAVRWPLRRANRDVGALVVGLRRGQDQFDRREDSLLDDLAAHAASAVEAAVLVRDLQSSRRQLVAAREEERRRLRRDLHDGLGPQLTAVTLKLDAARNVLPHDPVQVGDLLLAVRADVRAAIDDIRRVVYELRPPGLDELGLVGALQRHASGANRAGSVPEIVITGADLVLPAPVEVAAYRIVTEAITNAVRHAAAAHCRVRIELDRALSIDVTDDGHGMPADWTAGVGIASMRERAEQLGGTLSVASTPSGTTIRATLPLDEHASIDVDGTAP